MLINQLETPCLVVDKGKIQRNIARMQSKMDGLGVVLRPHGKTAKNINVLNLMAAKHRQGITVSTVKEAEYYFAHGISDIVYAVGISQCKLERLGALIKQGADLCIILDSVEQVSFCSEFAQLNNLTISVLIEIDCDGERAGITPDDPRLLDIGEAVTQLDGLNLKGILTHAGGSYHCASADDLAAMAEQERLAAVTSATRLNNANMPCAVVSVGSTPTALFATDLTGVTEVRAGVFVFFDLVMAGLGVCDQNDIALSVVTSVIGKNSKKDWVLTDAGWMALSRDRGTANQAVDYGYGKVCDDKGRSIGSLNVTSTNQEHGIIECDPAQSTQPMSLPVGTKLRILPNHACATAAMHDRYYVTEDGSSISDVWQRINGW